MIYRQIDYRVAYCNLKYLAKLLVLGVNLVPSHGGLLKLMNLN